MKNLISSSVIGFLVLFALLVSCTGDSNNELTEQQKTEIINEIELIMDDVYNINNNVDQSAEKLVSIKASTGDYVYATGGKIRFTDYEEYVETIKRNFENVQEFIEFERTQTIIYPLSLNSATCTYVLEGKYINISGDTIPVDGCWTSVFKKFDDEWKVVQENGAHSN